MRVFGYLLYFTFVIIVMYGSYLGTLPDQGSSPYAWYGLSLAILLLWFLYVRVLPRHPVFVRLAKLPLQRRIVLVFVGSIMIITVLFASYYALSYYSASSISIQIISGTRTLGSHIGYGLQIRVSSPGIIPLELWPPTAYLFVDSYNLASIGLGKVDSNTSTSSSNFDHLNPGNSLTYRGLWNTSFAVALDPSTETNLRQTETNHIRLSMYFHQANAGWYSEEVVREISTEWTWPSSS